jgi:uncharacterized protein DUF6788
LPGLGEEAQAGPFGELGEHVAGLDAEHVREVASGPVASGLAGHDVGDLVSSGVGPGLAGPGGCSLRPRGELPLPRRPPRLHGPYHQWTRKKNGKTATRILTDDQLADYAPWFDNHKRLRELLAELEALSLDIADNDPRWNR